MDVHSHSSWLPLDKVIMFLQLILQNLSTSPGLVQKSRSFYRVQECRDSGLCFANIHARVIMVGTICALCGPKRTSMTVVVRLSWLRSNGRLAAYPLACYQNAAAFSTPRLAQRHRIYNLAAHRQCETVEYATRDRSGS